MEKYCLIAFFIFFYSCGSSHSPHESFENFDLSEEQAYFAVVSVSPGFTSGKISVFDANGKQLESFHRAHSDLKVFCDSQGFYVIERYHRDNLTYYPVENLPNAQWQISTNQHANFPQENLQSANANSLIFINHQVIMARMGSPYAWIFDQANPKSMKRLDLSEYAVGRSLPDLIEGKYLNEKLYLLLAGYVRDIVPWQFETPELLIYSQQLERLERVSLDPILNPVSKIIKNDEYLLLAGQGDLMGDDSTGGGILKLNTQTLELESIIQGQRIWDFTLHGDDLWFLSYQGWEKINVYRLGLKTGQLEQLSEGHYGAIESFAGGIILLKSDRQKPQIEFWQNSEIDQVIAMDLIPQQIAVCRE